MDDKAAEGYEAYKRSGQPIHPMYAGMWLILNLIFVTGSVNPIICLYVVESPGRFSGSARQFRLYVRPRSNTLPALPVKRNSSIDEETTLA
jgi:hypothetical protein